MASKSPAITKGQQDIAAIACKDLLIIGPGVLGKFVAELWMKEFPGCHVAGQTLTTDHHEELQSRGIKPLLRGKHNEQPFPFVVFSAPPSRSLDYGEELRLASQQWNGEGVFLFTSSSAVYDCMDNGDCNEDTPVVSLGHSPRTDVILRAEEEVLKVGGTIVRLAGLYTKDRGPHAYWVKKGVAECRGDHILNLIHYEDAASLCVTVLKGGYRGEIFLGCDNLPLSRQEMMDIVNESGKYEDKFQAFTVMDGALGKKMNCNRTRMMTGWQPRHMSFVEFIRDEV
ncbi:hypothetical protein KP509_35G049300 [Ceratopteris richardii]|nr:hypothetical protein KP509_35G049300 [Ceratopteris richardii]KAH7282830.1 hypothetical protein KP509_35G049300 [Ceratopteris richardii]